MRAKSGRGRAAPLHLGRCPKPRWGTTPRPPATALKCEEQGEGQSVDAGKASKLQAAEKPTARKNPGRKGVQQTGVNYTPPAQPGFLHTWVKIWLMTCDRIRELCRRVAIAPPGADFYTAMLELLEAIDPPATIPPPRPSAPAA